jgi:putative endonuclease
MYYVYILRFEKTGRHYVGQTQDLQKRLQKHRQDKTKSVKNRGSFEIVYVERFATRAQAMRREKEIKSYKGGHAFEKLLQTPN